MPLTPGSRHGPYEILSSLGEGGMGIVYRARDRKLDRDVAIKVIPELFAADPDRVARFEREAKTLAQLNHPNIAAIYGLEETADTKALVLELVEGPTLADRISQGPVPFDEASGIARQIADALTAAHEAGIVHRDLKPANVKLRPDGTVKVLDFGLAKALAPDGAAGRSGSVSMSPTLTTPAMTAMGVVMGTAAYMAPEQAKGRSVDKRADIWALGCVLFEMLTGKRPFDGDDMSDVLATVLKSEPDWTSIPDDVPQSVQALVRRCLEKDPRKRVADASVVRFVLDEPLAAGPPRRPDTGRSGRWRLIVGGSVAAGALVAATAWLTMALTRPVLQPFRFAMVPADSQPFAPQGVDRDIAITPDGRQIVYRARVGDTTKLVVRDVSQPNGRALDATENARTPAVSSDGLWVAFFTGTVLKKVALSGGPPLTISDFGFGSTPRGASWNGETIVVATANPQTGLLSVPAGGGTPTVITTPDSAAGELDHFSPSFLPDGNRVLFTIASAAQVEPMVAMVDLRTKERTVVLRGGRQPQYVEPDALVVGVAGTLRAARFDPTRAEVLSEPVPVIEQVSTPSPWATNYAVSRNGMLIYVAGGDGAATGARRTLVWVRPDGREDPIAADARAFLDPRISPDERQVLVEIKDAPDDVWTLDVTRGTLTRQTFEEGEDETPAWMPDGKTLVYSSSRTVGRAVYRRRADGAGGEETLWSGSGHVHVESVTSDGKALILSAATTTGASMDLMLLPTDGKRELQPLLQTRFSELGARLSPDGRWMAYASDESGRTEVYVRGFPSMEGKIQVSTAGGMQPVWSRRGDELYFLTTAAAMAVRLQTGATVSVGQPRKLFENRYFTPGGRTVYDVARDGRFLMIKEETAAAQGPAAPTSLNVVLNWHEELRSKIK